MMATAASMDEEFRASHRSAGARAPFASSKSAVEGAGSVIQHVDASESSRTHCVPLTKLLLYLKKVGE
jgi:hypothetical protein